MLYSWLCTVIQNPCIHRLQKKKICWLVFWVVGHNWLALAVVVVQAPWMLLVQTIKSVFLCAVLWDWRVGADFVKSTTRPTRAANGGAIATSELASPHKNVDVTHKNVGVTVVVISDCVNCALHFKKAVTCWVHLCLQSECVSCEQLNCFTFSFSFRQWLPWRQNVCRYWDCVSRCAVCLLSNC